MHRLERSGLGSVGTWTEAEIGCVKSMHRLKGVPSVESRGPPRRVSAYEISKFTGFQVDFGFQNGFLDFKVDFAIFEFGRGFYGDTYISVLSDSL